MRRAALVGCGIVLLAVAVLFLLVVFWPTDPVIDCLDAGGRWVPELEECECTPEDRGFPDTLITPEEYEVCRKVPSPS